MDVLARGARYSYESVGLTSGLPKANATTALQTRDGYLWVGTQSGLMRYDGVRFDAFGVSNTEAFKSNMITSLLEDRTHRLWVGTERGLIRYERDVFGRVGGMPVSVTALAEDSDGTIWLGTADGLFRVEGSQLVRCDRPGELQDTYIGSLMADDGGTLWIGFVKQSGVECFRNGHFVRTAPYDQIDGQVVSMAKTTDGSRWFGCRAQGLFRLSRGELTHLQKGLFRTWVSDLRPASDGGLWIADGQPQKIEDPAHPEVVTLAGAPTSNVDAICEDREGSLWLCAAAEGLVRTQRLAYPFLGTDDGLPGAAIKTVSEDPSGTVWLAIQYKGVVAVKPNGDIIPCTNRNLVRGRNPTLVYSDREGSAWVAVDSRLYRIDGSQTVEIPGLAMVRGVYEDRAGEIWVGSETQGLFRRQGVGFEPVLGPHGESILHATSFADGPNGILYVGTWTDGIYAIQGQAVRLITRGSGLPSNDIRALYSDPDGNLWVGMRAGGVAVLDHGRWLSSSLVSDAFGGFVSAFADDRFGHLWLGGPAGVMWVDRAQLLSTLRGEQGMPPVRNLGIADGLHAASVWSGSQPIVWKEPGGRLLFATRSGLLGVDPEHLSTNVVPPPVHIRSVLVDGRAPTSATGGIEVPAGASQVAIDYSVLSFTRPSQLAIQYRLEGYDTDWIDAGVRRTAYYSHLPPGHFVFHVRARNSGGEWSQPDATLEVDQAPFFYQTWWFYGLLAAVGVAAAVGLNAWSHRRLKTRLEVLEARQAMERERRRIAKDLHDDLGANLTALGYLADRVRRRSDDGPTRNDLAQIGHRIRAVADSLDTVVWTVNPANDTLDRFASYVCGMFQDLFGATDIRSRLDMPASIPAYPLDTDKRTHLLLAAKEAMNNVAKHAHATEVWLRLRIENNGMSLAIEDNGTGFLLSQAEGGGRNGLRNLKARLAEAGGTLEIETEPGCGTRMRFKVPLSGLRMGRVPSPASAVTA